MEVWKRFHEKEVSHSMAHYLQAVAALKRLKGHARVGDIAERLGVSRSGVTSMLRSLQSRGLVDHEKYGCVELTPSGLQLAERTESNRQVLTLFLRDILGVAPEKAEEDACMIEHLVSAEVMAPLLRLTRLLRSDDPAAEHLLRVFREWDPPCEETETGTCEICGETESCLHESYEQEAAGEGSAG
jgi:Mn-dependent DtxR family transcriptional regulator